MSGQKFKSTVPKSTVSAALNRATLSGAIPPRRRMTQNYLVIWVDGSIDENNSDCRNTLAQLRAVVSDVNVCTTSEQCVEFLNEIDDGKAFIISSGALGQSLTFLMGSNKLTAIDETECSSSSESPENSFLQPSPTKPTITKTYLNKGKFMLIVNGYNFQFKNFNRKKTIKFWSCTNRSCNVILHTNFDDTFIRFSGTVTDHNHLPNPADLELRDLKRSMKTRAATELAPLKEIVEQEMRKALLTGEALAVLPSASDIGHTLKHHRGKLTPALPNSSSFFIPDLYKRYYNNKERLLLHDIHDSTLEINELENARPAGRVLVWASDVQLKLLFCSERLYMDGAFGTSPP
ncbi:unnamed protein product, partial [Rotaria socialis]